MLKEHHDAGFVILQVALAQIEGIEQHRSGILSEGLSKKFFCARMKRIFSLPDIYDEQLREDFYPLESKERVISTRFANKYKALRERGSICSLPKIRWSCFSS